MGYDIQISSDFGMVWGNYSLTPQELVDKVEGIELVDGELVIERVQWVNIKSGNEYIIDRLGRKITLKELFGIE